MNHMQMFRYVQGNMDLFDYELRAMMKTINNSIDLEKMRKDLLLLLKFTELKMQDEQKYFDSNYKENLSTLLLEHTE